jgi:Sec-independent protein translocase protein TatA
MGGQCFLFCAADRLPVIDRDTQALMREGKRRNRTDDVTVAMHECKERERKSGQKKKKEGGTKEMFHNSAKRSAP